MRPLTYHEAIRILLEGTCGVNAVLVEREVGVSRQAVMRFLRGASVAQETVDQIGLFVWRKLHAHELLSAADCHGAVKETSS